MTLIEQERRRQIRDEGWTEEHDDRHGGRELSIAGGCYLLAAGPGEPVPEAWPWEQRWWKPKGRRANLIRAGALFLAEKERLERRLRDLPINGYRARAQMHKRVGEATENARDAAAQIDELTD